MSKKTGAGLSFAEALKVMEVAAPEEMACFRTQQASDDADREFGAPPKRGRPRKDAVVEPVVGKTVKQTPAFWAAMAAKAQERGITLHEAMREALLRWVQG